MLTENLDLSLEHIDLDQGIIEKLSNQGVANISDLYVLKRKDLKKLGLKNAQINHVIIKLQLSGLDLNKKIYEL